ncbi:MAG: isochorismatase family protein [Eubacterium sp.]
MRAFPIKSAVIVIDMQEKLLPAMDEKQKILDRTCKLLETAQLLDIPILLTEQYPKGLGETVREIKDIVPQQAVAKTSFSACLVPEVNDWLADVNRELIFICGVESHVCVLQTAMDLKASGYTPVIVKDCVGSRTSEEKDGAIVRAVAEGVKLITFEQLAFELIKDSKHPKFKQISEIVKR